MTAADVLQVPAGPLGLPWTAWAVAVAIAIQTLGIAAALGGLFAQVRNLSRWLSRVATNTERTTEAVTRLDATVAAKIREADVEHHAIRAEIGGVRRDVEGVRREVNGAREREMERLQREAEEAG